MSADPFADVRDKVVGQMTVEQFDRADELWLRENAGWYGIDMQEHLRRLFRIIDRLRNISVSERTPQISGDERRHVICLCPDCTKSVAQLRTTRDGAATVDPKIKWRKITADDRPTIGARVLLINRAAGVAQIAPFKDDGWYTHFAGLPVFGDEE